MHTDPLFYLLKRRIGPPTLAQTTHIEALSSDDRGQLAEALADFQQATDLDAGLDAHYAD